ncbi:MAG: DUF3617 domain-containing protein [Sphingomicrobium sp.]
MTRISRLVLAGGGVTAALALIAAARPVALADTQPGLWEISGAPGARTPLRQCVRDIAALARFEHRSNLCTAKVLKDGHSSTVIDYSCGAAGFGHSEIDVITPRALRISTQGISDGLPFNYVLQARRIDDCPKSTAFTHH